MMVGELRCIVLSNEVREEMGDNRDICMREGEMRWGVDCTIVPTHVDKNLRGIS